MNRPFLSRWQPAPVLLAALAAAALAGCASPGPLPPPLAPLSGAQLGLAPAAADAAASAPQAAAPAGIDASWWRQWGDPQLDALVERTLAAHPSLQAAQARLLRAQAASAGSRALDEPQAALSASAQRQRYTEHGMVPPPIAGSVRNNADVQLGASLELDFFGRNRAALDAALGQERAAQADIGAAQLWLAAQVVRSHVTLARLLAQRTLVEQSLALRGDALALTRQRVEAGLDSQVELQQSAATLPELRGQLAALDEQIVLQRHLLAALSLQPADALAAYQPRLQPLPGWPAQQPLTLDLLGRRADLAAARARVEAAESGVLEARRQFYPNLSLNAFAGLSALGLDNLVDLGSRQFGAGPALRLPLFESGRLRAQLHGRAADRDAAVAAYNAALLDAVREAVDAQSSLTALERQQQEQAAQQSHLQLALEHARERQQRGLSGQLPVLALQQQLLAQQRAAVDLQGRSLDAQVRLIQALGGGWNAGAAGTRQE